MVLILFMLRMCWIGFLLLGELVKCVYWVMVDWKCIGFLIFLLLVRVLRFRCFCLRVRVLSFLLLRSVIKGGVSGFRRFKVYREVCILVM